MSIHDIEQAALCQRYENLSKIQREAHDLGMHIDDVNDEQRCYDFIISNWEHQYQLRLADEWRGDQNKCRAALGQLLEQVYQMQGMFPNDEALELAIKDAEEALS